MLTGNFGKKIISLKINKQGSGGEVPEEPETPSPLLPSPLGLFTAATDKRLPLRIYKRLDISVCQPCMSGKQVKKPNAKGDD